MKNTLILLLGIIVFIVVNICMEAHAQTSQLQNEVTAKSLKNLPVTPLTNDANTTARKN